MARRSIVLGSLVPCALGLLTGGTALAQPANNNCANATSVGSGAINVAGTTVGATADGVSTCAPGSPDVWYTFVAPASGTMQVKDCSANAAFTVLTAYANCGGADGNQIACMAAPTCSSGGLAFDVVNGRSYRVRVATTGGPGTFSLSFQMLYGLPMNDACSSPIPIVDGTWYGWTGGVFPTYHATNDGCTTCGGSQATPDVWFSYTNPDSCTRTVTATTCGSNYDTVLSAHTACPQIGFDCHSVACSDDNPSSGCAANSSTITFSVAPGQTMKIRVAGYNLAVGNFQLNVSSTISGPANQTCATATTVGEGAFPFNTCGSLYSTFPCLSFEFLQTVTYRYAPSAAGTATVSTCGQNIDTVVLVEEMNGSTCSTTGSQWCNDNGCGTGSYVTFPTVAGRSYIITVGRRGGNTGTLYIENSAVCGSPGSDHYRSVVLSKNPAGYWRLKLPASVAADEVGRPGVPCGNHPGVFEGPVAAASSAIIGAAPSELAATFNGSSTGVTQIFAPRVDIGFGTAHNFTISAWVRTNNSLAGPVVMQRSDPNSTCLGLMVGTSPAGPQYGKAIFSLEGPGIHHGAVSGASIDDGQWHFLTGLRQAYLIGFPPQFLYSYQIYVDGVISGYDNLSIGAPASHYATSGDPWMIGRYPAWDGIYTSRFTGDIDEVATFALALGSSEISTIYHAAFCAADVDDGSGLGHPDRGVDINDLLYFLAQYEAGLAPADLDDGSGTGTPDGGVDINDLLFFLAHYEAGC